jgi:hypothetical protein
MKRWCYWLIFTAVQAIATVLLTLPSSFLGNGIRSSFVALMLLLPGSFVSLVATWDTRAGLATMFCFAYAINLFMWWLIPAAIRATRAVLS